MSTMNKSLEAVQSAFNNQMVPADLSKEQVALLESIINGAFMGAKVKAYYEKEIHLVEDSIEEASELLRSVVSEIVVSRPYKEGWQSNQAIVRFLNGSFIYIRLSKELLKRYDIKPGMKLDKDSMLSYKVLTKDKQGEDKIETVFYIIPLQ